MKTMQKQKIKWICILDVPEHKEKEIRAEAVFAKIMAEDFPKRMHNMEAYIEEALIAQSRISIKKKHTLTYYNGSHTLTYYSRKPKTKRKTENHSKTLS